MLVAILTGNRKLAKLCNMLPDKHYDIYASMGEACIAFINKQFKDKKILDDAENALSFLHLNRKAHKSALMCYLYNQQHRGRYINLITEFKEDGTRDMSEADNAVLKYFAYNYESFIEDVFPLLNTQLSLLEEAMIYVIEQDSAVEINTLDKCILRYDYGHMVTEKRSF